MPFLGDGLHGVLQHAVNAVLHGHFGIAGFNVNIAGAALERGEDDGFDETDDRADGCVAAGQAIAGDGLFAFFFFLGDLQSKGFGGLLQNALRLFGALEQVRDLTASGNFDGKLLAQEQRKLIAHLHLAGIGGGDGKHVVVGFQRDKV